MAEWSEADPALALVANYEYDPYGDLFASTGDYADERVFLKVTPPQMQP